MADRYWVGGSATWDATAASKWAATSGGAGGEAVPTVSDAVFFDANSGFVTVTLGTGRSCASLDFTGFTGTFNGGASFLVAGSFILSAGMTFGYSGQLTISGTGSVDLAGHGKSGGLTVNAPASVVTLASDLTLADGGSLNISAGHLDLAGFNATANDFNSTLLTTRELTLGSGLLTLTANGTFWSVGNAGITINAGVSNIAVSGTGLGTIRPRILQNNVDVAFDVLSTSSGLQVLASTGALDITFQGEHQALVVGDLDPPTALSLTLTGLVVSGLSLTQMNSIQGAPLASGTQSSISMTSGTIALSNMVISDMTFTGGATFTATSSIDLGNNSGITITAPAGGGGGTVGHSAFSG